MISRSLSSGSILRDSKANKEGLSYALDGTMRRGAHDMKTFGSGTLRALATRNALFEFLDGHRIFYHAMEAELDAADGPTANVWKRFQGELRRFPALEHDCAVLSKLTGKRERWHPSPAAAAYVSRLREAGRLERLCGTPVLLGHFYTRYLADLFGGSMLGWPTKLACGLHETPRFYQHSGISSLNRGQYVESIYEALNDAGKDLSASQESEVVNEATLAFALNAALYKEGIGGQGTGMLLCAAVGGLNVAVGFARDRIAGGKKSVFGKL